MSSFGDVLTSALASSTSLWRGTSSRPAAKQPKQLLELYEFENCPFCRLVRETLTELDIDAMIYPCPKGGKRYRTIAKKVGKTQQLPFLVDANTGKQLSGSADIVAYLYKTYDDKEISQNTRNLQVLSSFSSTLARHGKGNTTRVSKLPEQPLVLYSFESSPFSRRVRELLCELELPYELRNTGKATIKDMGPVGLRKTLFPNLPVTGRNRIAMLKHAGKVQVPYLIDPNTNTEMFESDDIIEYLISTYAV